LRIAVKEIGVWNSSARYALIVGVALTSEDLVEIQCAAQPGTSWKLSVCGS